jgi:multimeric flavodoxin WrbA
MVYVLAALATNRRAGFTASVLAAACAGARQAGERLGVEVTAEVACLAKFNFKPCLSSFWCARNKGVGCVLPDDMGSKGEGVLFAKVARANGLLLATPVHTWGPSALAHMFWERLYPFLYSDGMNGLPFGALACATNQGFQRQAIEEMVKWAFCRNTRYQGGVAAHVMDKERVLAAARELGVKVGEAAVIDQRDGRRKFTDAEKFTHFEGEAFKVLDPYLDNVTDGSLAIEGSLPDRAVAAGLFKKQAAIDLASQAREQFALALAQRQQGELSEANQTLMRASAFWTQATWKEYVEEYVSKRPDVPPYRELPEAD